MPHIGLVCPPMHGHMHPMFSLGRELTRRGHRVTVLSLLDARRKAEAAGLDFHAVGTTEFPEGSIAAVSKQQGRLTGPRAVAFTLRMIRRESSFLLEELPEVVRRLGVELLAVDQTAPAGGTTADLLGIPFVTVCNALMIDQEPGVPPIVTHWRYSPSRWAQWRNRCGAWLMRLVARSIFCDVNRFRRHHGLPGFTDPHQFSSELAILSQTPAAFDYPRRRIAPWFHYLGPFCDPAGREPAPFPYERLDGRPLIYASLGTLQNQVEAYFRAIATACAPLPAQLAMGLGGADPERLGALPGDPIVVRYAPQVDLLRRAALTITHAGLNTVLESLSHGVPVVAIPITNDQPGVASRVEWFGVGARILPRRLTADRLRATVERVLNAPKYRANALRMQQAIAATEGATGGAKIIEQVLATRAPVLRGEWNAGRG